MAEYIWDEADDLGHETMDAQHRELMALVDLFSRSADVDALLTKLIAFTQSHFLHEESLFGDYPDGEDHRRHHRHLMLILTRFAQSYRVTSEPVEPWAAFLRDWLMNHIRTDDRGLAEYLEQKDGARAVV